MKKIGKYLAQKKKQADLQSVKRSSHDIDDQTLFHLFSRAVREEYGRQGEKNIVPTFYKNGVIFVKINNSIWAQELWMHRSFFVNVINEKIGSDVIKNIKIAT